MKKIIVMIINIGLFISVLISCSSSIPSKTLDCFNSNQYDIYVDDNADPEWYDSTHVRTIQEGIQNASSGQSIFVYIGLYIENIHVNKMVDLTGESSENTIINGNFVDNVVYVTSDNVSISHFTIKYSAHIWGQVHAGIYVRSNNTKIFKNIITENWHGIYLDEISHNNLIFENNISYNSDYGSGLFACGSDNNLITNNTLLHNIYGITIESYVVNNIITKNLIRGNLFGIRISFHADNNTIKENNLINNNWGLDISFYSNNNNITNNKLIRNTDGIFLHDYSGENIIFKNNITKGYYGIHLLTNYFSVPNQIIKNIITDNYCGIEIRFSHNTFVFNNKIINNYHGIYNYGSWFTIVLKNRFISDTKALILMYANNNTVYENMIFDSEDVGIFLNNSFENSIYHNALIENGENAFDEGENFWYSLFLNEGNYWNDFKQNPGFPNYYEIPGGDNIDYYPLESIWIDTIG